MSSTFSGISGVNMRLPVETTLLVLALLQQALPAAVMGSPGMDTKDDRFQGNDSLFSDYKNTTSKKVGSPRIIGGTAVNANHYFPWFARIWRREKQSNNKWEHHCGGALITHNWVLTAAHCIIDEPNCDGRFDDLFLQFDYGVAIGEYEWTKLKWFISDYDKCFKKDRYPKGYKTFKNDIALLKLKHNSGISLTTIALPDNSLEKTLGKQFERQGTIIGWGRTKYEDTSASHTLLKLTGYINIYIMENDYCTNEWNSISRQLCFTSKDNAGACYGDSGGPLFVKGLNGQYVLLGIASHGELTCTTNRPTIYTRVYSYLEWIDRTIKNN